MKSEVSSGVNLFDLKPIRNVQFETADNGLVVLLVPKFQGGFLGRWLAPLLAKQNIRVKLDIHGTFIWNACDGKTSVQEIGEKMSSHFGEERAPLYDRIGKFIRKLDESQFVLIHNKGRDAEMR